MRKDRRASKHSPKPFRNLIEGRNIRLDIRLAGDDLGRIRVARGGTVTVEALMDLRKRVDETLLKHRAEIEQQLERIAVVGGTRVVRGGGQRRSALRGRKVPPKYRSPSGETWAGRGARPRWLVAAIKGGKKLDDFLIDKSGRKGRKKRRSKR